MTAPTLGCKVHAVVIVMVELPLAVPLGTSAKFTKPGVAETVSEVLSVAVRLTLAMFALSWARAPGHANKKELASSSAHRSCARFRHVFSTDPSWRRESKLFSWLEFPLAWALAP